MTDRELLELAAKAAGITYHSYVDSELFGCGINIGDVDVPIWNPLTDDGDALRLSTTLEMSIEISAYEASTYAFAGPQPRVYAYENWGEDKLAATRRAIVRAAAEIGKAMP